MLDAAGLPDVRITVSGGLDEYAVDELVCSGAPTDVHAVGTRVGVPADAPYLASVYKMVEYDGRPVMKLSSAKVTAPGRKQVFRCPGCVDVISLADERHLSLADERHPRGGRPLLETVMHDGQRTRERATLTESAGGSPRIWPNHPRPPRRIRTPVAPRARPSERLNALAGQVRRRIAEQVRPPWQRRRAGTNPPASGPRRWVAN